MSLVRLAVIGVGHLGRIHARLASSLPGAELVAVVDPVAEAREQVAQQVGVLACDDHRKLLGHFDAAIVATPTRQHHAVAADLLSRGIHTFIEKPITTGVSDADELVELADEHGAVLQVGHVERFNPAFIAAQPHVAAPKYLEAVRCGPFTGRSTDIGVVLDLMIHDIDLVLSLVNSEVISIESLGAAVFGPNEDWAQARLSFADGSVAHLRASRVSHSSQRTLEAWCLDRQVSIDFACRKATVMRHSRQVQTGQIDVQRLSPQQRSELSQRLFTELLPVTELAAEETNAIAQEQQEFIASIRSGAPVRVSGRDGRAALDVAEQIMTHIIAHRWDGTSEGPIGPRLDAVSRPLAGPHFSLSAAAAASKRRAG